MPGIKVATFLGAKPVISDRLIPENVAAVSENQRIESGALEPIRAYTSVKNLVKNSTEFVLRIPNGDVNDLNASHWIEFDNLRTDVVRTPVVNDTFKRWYWCSPSTGLKYLPEATLISSGPSAGLDVGVARPAASFDVAIVANTGGTHNDEVELKTTRVYVLTYVTIYGEESAPSLPKQATGYTDQTWRVSAIPQPTQGLTITEIDKIRIYRSEVDAAGGAAYYRVTELNVGTTSYDDTTTPQRVTANPQLETEMSNTPVDMNGIALMPNGIMVGFKGTDLFFSEPYKPHSWPAAYRLSVQHEIIGLAVQGSTCVICTDGNPCTVTGVSPATMTLSQSDVSLPCLFKKSIVSAPEGVYYATSTGLVIVDSSGPRVITDDIIGRELWESDFKPAGMYGGLYLGSYIGCRNRASFGRSLFIIREGTVIEYEMPTAAIIGMDEYSNKPWMIAEGKVFDLFPINTGRRSLRWLSKVFILPNQISFGACQVYYDAGGNPNMRLKIWADGNLIFDELFTISALPKRIPGGFKSDRWQFEITTTARVHQVIIAQTIKDLKIV